MERMLEEVEYCNGVVKKRFNKPLKMTKNDELCFKLMDKCYICGNKYTDKDVLVRDQPLPYNWEIQRLSTPRM